MCQIRSSGRSRFRARSRSIFNGTRNRIQSRNVKTESHNDKLVKKICKYIDENALKKDRQKYKDELFNNDGKFLLGHWMHIKNLIDNSVNNYK